MSRLYFAYGKPATMMEWSEIVGVEYERFRTRARRYGLEGALAMRAEYFGAMTDDRLELLKIKMKPKIIAMYEQYIFGKKRAEAEREQRKREEDEEREREEEKKRQERTKKLLEINSDTIYKVIYYCRVNAGAGYWATKRVRGAKLRYMLDDKWCPVESYEVAYD